MTEQRERSLGQGALAAITTNLIWGTFPIYFAWLAPAPPGEIVAARAIFSFVVIALAVVLLRKWTAVVRGLRNRRALILLAIAGLLIYGNWILYVTTISVGRVLEASLAYFITPILSALLGVVVLRERASLLFWISFGLASLAVVVLIVGYGEPPWLGLALAATFAVYMLLKRLIGGSVDAVSGLAIETSVVLPVGVIHAIAIASTAGLLTGTVSTTHTALMLGLGIVSLLPFVTFAAASARLPLIWLSFIGYITPALIFLDGVFYFREEMPLSRWIGFGIIWAALVVFGIDAWRQRGREPGATTAPVTAPG